MTRVCILILGMHRSGTSALAGTLGHLGADMPEHQIVANPTNPTGHWEPERLVRINDRLLTEAGSGWRDWRGFDPAVLPEERVRSYRDEIATCLDDEYGRSPLFVLKDPRISRMVPFYVEILGSMDVGARHILCIRNPVDVMDSLARRNGISAGSAALLWLRHVLDAERATRDMRRCLVSYEAMLEDWRGVTARIAATLAIEWPRTIDAAAADIDPFLQRDLRHRARPSDRPEPNAQIAGWTTDTYRALLSLIERDGDAAAFAELDRVSAELEPGAVVFGSATFPDLAEREQRLEVMAAELRVATRRSERLEKTLESMRGSRSWQLTRPLRRSNPRAAQGSPRPTSFDRVATGPSTRRRTGSRSL